MPSVRPLMTYRPADATTFTMWARLRLCLAVVVLGQLPGVVTAASAIQVEDQVRAILVDPDAPGPVPLVKRLEISEFRAVIGLVLPSDVRLDDIPASIENRYETAVGALAALRPKVAQIDLLVGHPGGDLAPPKQLASLPAQPRPPRLETILPDPMRFPEGQALRGKTIAISPGHGYIYYDSLGRYSTQRSNIKWEGCGSCDGIIEDFGSHQLAIDHLIPLLEGAGARVILVRERDKRDQGLIVDNGDANYVENAGQFTDGSNEGGHGGNYRVSSDANAEVQWTLNAPQPGLQMLSLWFLSGENRHGDAWVEVNGGTTSTRFLLDMTSHGRRWVPVGLMQLSQGLPVTVKMSAPSNPEADHFLIADAVRLGSGAHSSGHAWWSMGAAPFAEYQGAPAFIQNNGDVSIRPRYAEFYGADAYVSLHSNASGQPSSTAAGTASYRFNCGSFPDHSSDPPAASCDDPVGSDRLQADVHAGMVSQLKADWDPNWADRGPKVANFGEMRSLDGIPGVLMESAFHDNVALSGGSSLRMTDNQAMHDPRWRRAAAIGLYRGISRFFAPSAPFVMAAPEAVVVRRVDNHRVQVSFSTIPGASSYRVYAAADDGPFDAGLLVSGSPAEIANLPEGAVISVRVASVSPAGEGTPSSIVSARASRRPAQALIVDAFTREDAWVQEWDNPKNTARTHAWALGGTEYGFDGANEAALAAGLVTVADYDALIVALGRESTEDEILTAALRQQVSAATQTAIFFGGTEIGWALDARGDATTRAFLDDVFGAVYAADDAQSGRVVAAGGGWLQGAVDTALADGTQGLVQTHFPDAFTLGSGGVAELTYENGSDLAGVRKGNNLILGVALDNLVGADARAAVLGGWLSQAVELAPEDLVPPTPDAGVADVPRVPDAGMQMDASVIQDAGYPDVQTSVVRLRPTNAVPIRGGCTCLVPSTNSGLGLLGLLFLVGYRRRQI